MKHYRRFSVALVVLAIVVLSCMLITPNTYARAQDTPPPANNGCAVQMVYLNGENPPTITCLQQSVPPGQTIRTSGSDCSSSTLSFRSADKLGDLYLCFLGTGFVNLSDYTWRLWPANWDNMVDWYGTGCNSGTFFADSNGNGTQQKFGPGVQGYFDGQNGRLQDATLSSFQITSSC